MRLSRWRDVNSQPTLGTDGFRVLVENTLEAALAKGVKEIGAMPAEEWADRLKGRIGREPMVRLLYILFRDAGAIKKTPVTLPEMLAEDPPLFVRCMEDLNMSGYWALYPPT